MSFPEAGSEFKLAYEEGTSMGNGSPPSDRIILETAATAHLAGMVHLAERRRAAYEPHQPVFWRKAKDSAERQKAWFERQIEDPAVIAIVALRERLAVGLIVGRVVDAPPVYDPGGRTCMVDDFTVSEPGLWPSVGGALLDELKRRAGMRGVVQTVVVAGHHDRPKQSLLDKAGFKMASTWWVG
jgi:GNAT superfamily N-acetyltransferase